MGLPQEKIETAYSLDEYFALCLSEKGRYEYYHGGVFNMAGGTLNHGRITGNLNAMMNGRLPSKCEAFSENARTILKKEKHYVYPDVVATCHPLDLSPENKFDIYNPFFVAEVLSDSTRAYDQGTKKRNYLHLPSLRYLLLIEQDEPFVEVYQRNKKGKWEIEIITEMEDVIRLSEPEVSFSLSELYHRVVFPVKEEESEEDKGK